MVPVTQQILQIAQEISPLLAGEAPETQGAVLAELLSMWLGGHRPDLRDAVLEMHIRTVKALTVVNDKWQSH